MTAQNPKDRSPYIYAWLVMAAVIGLLIFVFHLI